jgi:phosphoribosylamine-glycine ligase
MLKPTNLMKSLFITMNDTLDELRANYAAIISSLDDINNKVYTMYPPQVLIEECMEGSMHTVAGFADASGRAHLYGQVVDCITGHDAGKGENYIYSRQLPSACSDNDVAEILEVSRQGVIALGLTNTMLHIELMLTSTGPKIIEIGARIGGYRSRMYAHASGVDMYSIMLAVSRGEVPDIVQAQPRPIAVIELFPDTEGAFAGVTAREKLESLPSLHYFDIKARSGQTVGRASKGYKASAVVILAHNDPVQFHADCKAVSSLVRIEVS